MKAKTRELQSLDGAAKQVKNLINAVAQINAIKCPLSINQIKMLIFGTETYIDFYINKFWGRVILSEPINEDEYIKVRVSRWFEEEKYVVDIL